MTVEHIGQRTLYLLVIHDGIKAFDHDKDGADRHGKVLGVDPVAGVHPRFGRRINAGIPLQSAVGFQVVAIGQSLAVFGQDFVDGATVLMQLYGVILVFDGQAVALARNAQISFILRRGGIGIAIEEKIYLLFVCRDTGQESNLHRGSGLAVDVLPLVPIGSAVYLRANFLRVTRFGVDFYHAQFAGKIGHTVHIHG